MRRTGGAGRPWVAWAALATAGLLALAACFLRPVKLGAVLPLTGAYARYGTSMERGALLAAKLVNATGGIEGRRLEILVKDSASSEGRAAEAFQELVERDHVPAVVGGCTTGEALAMAPVAERFRRILFSPSASAPQITEAGGFVFRNWPSDDIEGQTMADFAAYTLHATRALVLSERNPYAAGIGGVFSQRFCKDGRSCETVRFQRGQATSEIMTEAAAELEHCQVVFIAGYGEDLAPVLGALRAQDPRPPVLSVSALAEGTLLKGKGAVFDGILFARPAYDPEGGNPAASEFAAAYAANYGREADIYAAHAYDAVRILAEVMSKGDLGAEAIRAGLLALRNYPGASGLTSFDAHGDVVQPFQICIVQGGRAVPLKSVMDKVLPGVQQRVEALRFGR